MAGVGSLCPGRKPKGARHVACVFSPPGCRSATGAAVRGRQASIDMNIIRAAALAALFSILAGPAWATCPYNPPPLVPGGWASPLPISKSLMLSCARKTVASQPREYIGEIFFNSGTGVGYAPGQWHEIDLTAMTGGAIPRAATSAMVSGLAIISNRTACGGSCFEVSYADMMVTFRKPGDAAIDPACNYSIQAFTGLANEGVRSGVSIRIPLQDGKVEMYWTSPQFPGVGVYPTFGLNLTVQDYCEPE